jgi:hypothetical protein
MQENKFILICKVFYLIIFINNLVLHILVSICLYLMRFSTRVVAFFLSFIFYHAFLIHFFILFHRFITLFLLLFFLWFNHSLQNIFFFLNLDCIIMCEYLELILEDELYHLFLLNSMWIFELYMIKYQNIFSQFDLILLNLWKKVVYYRF